MSGEQDCRCQGTGELLGEGVQEEDQMYNTAPLVARAGARLWWRPVRGGAPDRSG